VAIVTRTISSQSTPARKDGIASKKKVSQREHRRNTRDRRMGVREGIIVTLSFKDDRRVIPDRRRVQAY
jgi:hypothetical protein